ncbi:MAG: hypothetical protein IPO02_09540 [Bacteroidetes bacterium]|nr:hypothetical protein [Bacteroidota bacterium]
MKVSISYNQESGLPVIKVAFDENSLYNVPKIMYVPAERNLLTVIRNAYGIHGLPDTLRTFAEELLKGQKALREKLIDLPVGGIQYKYKINSDTSFLVGEDYELDMAESSSGYQSLVPLYLVTKALMN